MNPKMKSAIEKITLNDATFSNEVIEPTYVNFFYGKNGAGKSTIARTFKANDERLQWQAGKASTDYDVLVYDTDFINANLRNYGNLAGVFTVNETNIAIQEQVDTLNAERKKMGEEYNGHKAAIDQKTADKNTALSTFQSDCWSKSAEARTLFDEAIKGKKKAALFAQEILAITPVAHDVEDLKTLYGTVFSGDAQQYNMLSKAGKVTYASLPGYELMGKPISSSSDTDFAKFIKALKATDWVRSGHTHFAGQTDGKCPYCQQKLPSNFDKEIAACFDAQYQDDISAINAFQRTYESEMDSVVATLEGNVSAAMPELDLSEYEVKVQLLVDAITINKQRIAAKIKEPTSIASLEDTDSLLIEIGTLIDGFNKKIKENNEIVRDLKTKKVLCKKQVEVIVEHFRTTVMQELGGQAKAMVITASRQGAVKYRQAFEEYITKKGYDGIHALVAFSGKVKLPDDDKEYTEASINGFPEDRLTKEFDTDNYQVLLVANKYQTGFDQPKLCAMYVLKKLRGVNAVQTLSRLNRICAPYDKKTFVLDFVNTYEDIKAAFAPYYTTTLLANSVTPNAIYDLEATIDAYALFDPADIEAANDILYSQKVTGKQKQRLTFFLQKSKKLLEHYEYETQRQAVADMRGFVRYYEFLLQVSSFEDTDLHKKYNFISYLLAYINIKHPGGGFNLDGKIKASQFVQKKGEEHVSSDLVAKPVMKLPTAEHFGLSEDKEKRLSEIIDEINSKTGKNYDNDVVVKAMLQIRDILMKSDKLKTSAKNNTQQDFEFSYFDDIDDALIEGLSQNQDFFSMLLSNDEMKHQVMGIFSDEIYKSLRESV